MTLRVREDCLNIFFLDLAIFDSNLRRVCLYEKACGKRKEAFPEQYVYRGVNSSTFSEMFDVILCTVKVS